MTATLMRIGLVVALTCGVPTASILAAETEGSKALPTLLIKGEVVSLDSADPAAVLLKVKDRYGFETPIFLTPETKVMQGQEAATTAGLTTGTAVEVEYNFDINTAKRHAVSVKIASLPAAQAMPTAMGSAPAAPVTPAEVSPAVPAAPAMQDESESSEEVPEAAPAATQDAPVTP